MILTKKNRLFAQFAPIGICKIASRLKCDAPSHANFVTADGKEIRMQACETGPQHGLRAWTLNHLLDWLIKEKKLMVHVDLIYGPARKTFVGGVFKTTKHGGMMPYRTKIHSSSVSRTVVIKTLDWILRDIEAGQKLEKQLAPLNTKVGPLKGFKVPKAKNMEPSPIKRGANDPIKPNKYDRNRNLKGVEVGDLVVDKEGTTIKITSDDNMPYPGKAQQMFHYSYIKRFATHQEVLDYMIAHKSEYSWAARKKYAEKTAGASTRPPGHPLRQLQESFAKEDGPFKLSKGTGKRPKKSRFPLSTEVRDKW